MTSLKAKRGWKRFDFDEVSVSLNSEESKIVSPKCTPKKKANIFNFEQQIVPKMIEDLAVHSKKINDIEFWLQNEVLSDVGIKKSSMLLITGPTGCGKTATVKVLCKKLNIEIKEWINPIDKDRDYTVGQISQLMEFLSGSTYPSLVFVNKANVVLIEDFPNSVIRDPTEFGQVLEKCLNIKSPVIFICTDANNLSLVQKLFPEDVRLRYSIHHISFNTTSNTLLKKALKNAQNLIADYPDTYTVPNQQVIDEIICSSMGDIRCAINQFYFACLKGSYNSLLETIVPKFSNKRKRKTKSDTRSSILIKDERLDFFHSLGRILNPKREEKNGSWRLRCDVGALIEEIYLQPATFNLFVHTNYIKYFGDIEDICNAADVLSFAQSFLSKWESREEMLKYGLWIPIMGLMIHNGHRVSKWNQITAPRKYNKTLSHSMDLKSLNVDRCYYDIINKS